MYLCWYVYVEINYVEFIAAVMRDHIELTEDRLKLAFAKLDIGGCGYVDVAAFKLAIETELGASDSSVDKFLSELDENHDGVYCCYGYCLN
jgi:Ca2+-binding EF-hand superfamily protein